MANLGIIGDIERANKRLKSPEEMLAKGLTMPFNNTNSGSRKIMYSTQIEHLLALTNPEIPLVGTGFENSYGYKSSSFIKSHDELVVIDKVFLNDKCYIIVRDTQGMYDVIERVSYTHITETYGYLYNNEFLDNLRIGDTIEKGVTIKKSMAFDENDNRMDGINLITTYLSTEHTKEDGITVSDRAAKKLSSPLIKKIPITINDNYIPLNIYGDDENYKSFPDIGEHTKDNILCALRIERREESLFSQSRERLKKIMMSDDVYTVQGKVIDINIYCNNPEVLNEQHYSQLKKYYTIKTDFNRRLVDVVGPIINSGAPCGYALQKLYYNCKSALEGTQYLKDNIFSNTIIEFVVLEEIPVDVGDKIANRYGGKGVVSEVRPEHLMPRLDNGKYVEVIFNSSTCVNRENAGQLLETSINHISSRIIEYIDTSVLHADEAIEEYLKFLSILSPDEGYYTRKMIERLDEDTKVEFLQCLTEDMGIIVSLLPISETVSIDIIDRLYKEFPYATQYKVTVPLKDSMGNIRHVPARRKLVAGSQYIYRLKQYAEEKLSAVSLSATNLRNENSRNSSKKNYKSIYSKTPIKFGEMETGDLNHLGAEIVVENLMLYSASPHGRRLAEQLLVDDPFDIDIKLDDNAKNRSVEIMNAYLLSMGLELVITKRRKQMITPIMKHAIKKIPQYAIVKDAITKINHDRELVQQARNHLDELIDPIRKF